MPRRTALFTALALLPAAACFADHHEEDGEKPDAPAYRRVTMDIGLVVTDTHAAEEFWEDALGFEEITEFEVDAETATKAGLTDGQPLYVDVMALGEGPDATRVKLMHFPKAPGARPDNRFIHSTLGPSYLTFHVADIDAALARAKKHGVKPLGEAPVMVGEGPTHIALIRDPDGNFIELVGPRTQPDAGKKDAGKKDAGGKPEAKKPGKKPPGDEPTDGAKPAEDGGKPDTEMKKPEAAEPAGDEPKAEEQAADDGETPGDAR